MNYPDKAPPAGFRLLPEVALAAPRVSDNAKTFTFTLRSGFRFSDGTPVRASAFERAIYRTLAPGRRLAGEQYTRAIVGAEAVRAGRTTDVAGVVASGRRLVIRLKESTPDFPARTTMPFFCAVPPTLPPDPRGSAPTRVPGPTTSRTTVPANGSSCAVTATTAARGLTGSTASPSRSERARTRKYSIASSGTRSTGASSSFRRPFLDPARGLKRKYGLNRSRFFLKPGLTFLYFALNTSRPLFANNPKLRRAVNFAFDRRAFRRVGSGSPLGAFLTDQYLPPTMPGYTNRALYPQSPDVTRARRLAAGNTRSGKATLYVANGLAPVAQAQVLRRNLAEIGLDVEIKPMPGGPALVGRLAARDEPWDIALTAWAPDYIDPFTYVNMLLDGQFAGASNVGRFDSAEYNRLMRRAARLQGASSLPGLRGARHRALSRRRSAGSGDVPEHVHARLAARRSTLHRPAARARPDRGLSQAMRRAVLPLAVLAVAAALLAAAQPGAEGAGEQVRKGGIFRISLTGFDYIDPALAGVGGLLLDTTCARLMTYPDKPPPEGLRLVPEVAAGFPQDLARRQDVHLQAA